MRTTSVAPQAREVDEDLPQSQERMEGARLKTSLEESPIDDSSFGHQVIAFEEREHRSPTRTEKSPQEPSVDHDEEASEQNDGCCYHFITESRVSRWPRSCSLLLGVVLPLLSLILLSMLFGALLARLEAPDEVSGNNAIVASELERLAVFLATGNFSALVPRFCARLFLINNTEGETLQEQLFDLFNDYRNNNSNESLFQEDINTNETAQMNETERVANAVDLATDLVDHMIGCIKASENVTDDITDLIWNSSKNEDLWQDALDAFLEDGTDADIAVEQLSLTWIRCYPGANPNSTYAGAHPRADNSKIDDLHPIAQRRYFAKVWTADFVRLREERFTADDSDRNLDAREALANRMALQDASGKSGCEWNMPASAWFWFTVMTTVGYGNQSPTTQGGRLLIYILGFVTILAFAGILAAAGYIVSELLEDAIGRFHHFTFLSKLSKRWVSCIFWGCAYYGWMFVIGGVTVWWKKDRLEDDEFHINDGYWFAYISTTTVRDSRSIAHGLALWHAFLRFCLSWFYT